MFKFLPGNAATLRSEMKIADENEAARVIEWARGNDVPGYRDRQGWILGDIISSTPVVVGRPSAFFFDEDYEEQVWSPKEIDNSCFCFGNAKNLKEVVKLIEDAGCDVQWNGSIKQRPTISWSI